MWSSVLISSHVKSGAGHRSRGSGMDCARWKRGNGKKHWLKRLIVRQANETGAAGLSCQRIFLDSRCR